MKALVLVLTLFLGHALSEPANAQDQGPEGINGLAGLWYDPAHDGEGFNIITTPAGTVLFYYGYTREGERLWLISELLTERISFGAQLELLMYEGNGGYFHSPRPSSEALSDWGRLRITFLACDEAQFELDGLDGLKTSNQTRLAGITDANCSSKALAPPSGIAGLWYDPDLDGEGFNIIVTNESTVFFFYGYDNAQQRLWLISEILPGAPRIGETFRVKMFAASGGTFDQPAPSSEALTEWGEVEVMFTHCDQASVRLNGAAGNKVSSVVQLAPIDSSTCAGSANGHNVLLRVVLVTEDWVPFASTDGWTQAVPLKETDSLKYYEAAIWEETQSAHLYAFPNSYDAAYGQRTGVTDEQKTEYRESFLVSKVTGLPASGSAREQAIKQAFITFSDILVERHPDSSHHLMYHGHGGPGGKLFQGELGYDAAHDYLQAWTMKLGRKLGVIDMGGPCNKGGYSDLQNFCRHAQYYIASDLENGGYNFDEWTGEKYYETEVELQYHRLFANQPDFQNVLTERIDLIRQRYLYSKNDMVARQVKQANYLYSCQRYAEWGPAFDSFLAQKPKNYNDSQDLYDYLLRNGASNQLRDDYWNLLEHQADNRDFFEWQTPHNGMLMPSH